MAAMHLLIVSATEAEVAPLKAFLEQNAPDNSHGFYIMQNLKIEFLYTGPGPVAATFHLTRRLLQHSVDLIIQAGIGGAFSTNLMLGAVVEVTSDVFGDLGAEDHELQLDLFELGFAKADDFPFTNGWLQNKTHPFSFLVKLQKSKGITVSLSSGNAATISRRNALYVADVESMEGAGAFYTAFQLNQPIIQLRSISNLVAPRNRAHWNIPLAISKLNTVLIEAIEELGKSGLIKSSKQTSQ